MKTNRLCRILLVVMITLGSPIFPTVAGATTPAAETSEQKVERLTKRIEEIKSIDKSTLSQSERKALRKEARQIRDEAKALSGGVYVSVGALLVILLLILLL